jgi:polyphosphate kinase
MTRNLNHRVEVVFPIENKDHIHHLRHRVLDTYLKDNTRARILQSNGTYTRLVPEAGKEIVDVQEKFMS